MLYLRAVFLAIIPVSKHFAAAGRKMHAFLGAFIEIFILPLFALPFIALFIARIDTQKLLTRHAAKLLL